MRIRFNAIRCLLLWAILSLWGIGAAGQAAPQHYYYVTAYDDNYDEGKGFIRVSKANLDSKKIEAHTIAPLYGTITIRTPLPIGNTGFLVAFACDGLDGKNSSHLDTPVSNYAVLDSNLRLLKVGQLKKIGFRPWYPVDSSQKIEFLQESRGGVNYAGRLFLNPDTTLALVDTVEAEYKDADYPTISGFRYFKKISFDNDSLY